METVQYTTIIIIVGLSSPRLEHSSPTTKRRNLVEEAAMHRVLTERIYLSEKQTGCCWRGMLCVEADPIACSEERRRGVVTELA